MFRAFCRKAVLISLVVLIPSIFGCDEPVSSESGPFINPHPADNAVNISPGEPAVTSLDNIPDAMWEPYGIYLATNPDNSFYWFDFNADGIWQPGPELRWHTTEAQVFLERVYYGFHPDSLAEYLSVGTQVEKRPPLLPDTTVFWQIRGTEGLFNTEETLVGPTWSFRTSGYDTGD